jgi:SAM-dependent methyltransferase
VTATMEDDRAMGAQPAPGHPHRRDRDPPVEGLARPAPSAHAARQYAGTTANLEARIAIHAHGTNPQDWFTWLDERLPRDGDVLEVGAGTGLLWNRVARRDRSLTLTDYSPAMCERLRTVAAARVLRCDATRLPFRDDSLDTLIADHMLYHVDDPEGALREFARVLRAGGRLATATNGRSHLAELMALAETVGRPDLRLAANQSDYSAEAAPGLVARHFADVTVERYHCDLAVPAPEPILAALSSLGDEPLTAQQSSAVRRIVGAAIDADGHYHIGKHTVLITATRP